MTELESLKKQNAAMREALQAVVSDFDAMKLAINPSRGPTTAIYDARKVLEGAA